MPKIAMIGAGSVGFAQKLIRDILSFPALRDTHFALMDIDPERMDVTRRVTEKLLEQENLPATVTTTTDRREALEGADYAICAILANGLPPFENEINIPYKYGITQPVGDTLCVGGVFRALRTIPIVVDICRDMDEVCPNAYMLNYTNPMPMVTWACNVAANVNFIGLCHGVQGTAGEMAQFIGVPPEEVRYWSAGINHLAWFLRFENAAGEDLYPLFWETLEKNGPPEHDRYRFDFAQHIGYFMTESSGHFSEYIPYYRKSKEAMAEMDCDGFAGRPGVVLESYHTHWKDHEQSTLELLESDEPLPFGERSAEYASRDCCTTPLTFSGGGYNDGGVAVGSADWEGTMQGEHSSQNSFFGMIYEELVPADHLLRKLAAAVDFGFVSDLVSDCYCPDKGLR